MTNWVSKKKDEQAEVEEETAPPKPATESNGQRREPSEGSRPSPITTAAGVASKSGRAVVDSGRQFGRGLADLAKSSVTMPEGSPPPAPDAASMPAPARAPKPKLRPKSSGNGSAGVAGVAEAAAATSPAAPKHQAPGRQNVRQTATDVAKAAAAGVASIKDKMVEPSEEYEFIVPSVPRRARQRLYPRWWKRIFSFVALGLLLLVIGIAAGAAIGALLALANRAIQGTL